MSHKNFDALADSIVARVKQDISMKDMGYRGTDQINYRENVKEGGGSRTQGGSNSDLSSHYCPLCHKLMLSPEHSPTILVPCGHSVCQSCSDYRSTCPTCRSNIASKTCNIMLQQIIQDYHSNRENVTRQKETSYKPSVYTEQYRDRGQKTKDNRNKVKYREEYENLKTRQDVLRSEVKSIQGHMKSLTSQIEQEDRQINNVAKEEEKVKGQIRSLEEKLQMLQSHKEQYEKDRDDLKRQKEEGRNKLNMAKDTLLTVEIEMEKCRERGISYKGRLQISMMWKLNGQIQDTIDKVIGEVPIMVKSEACNINKLPPAELIDKGEEAEEMGGYFICNGNEKVIRMLILQRRNYPMCMTRPSWKNRGSQYTEYGVSMRCVRPDQTGTTNVLHYLSNGSATLCFSFQKEMFFVPVVFILKSLQNVSDKYIFDQLVRGKEDDSFYKGCVVAMLRQLLPDKLTSQSKVLEYIGKRFQVKMGLPEWYTHKEVALFLLSHMTRKLFAFAKGECAAESADNPMFQEVLLGGHLYLMVLKEKIENWLLSLKVSIIRTARTKALQEYHLGNAELNAALRHTLDMTKSMEYLMATGNLVSKSGLGLMQQTGLTVVADKLNFFRYISHFRCVHRGAFFAEMRTTSVRKLLPEAWGFLCPVHTPDGSPCGLLNHMTALCQASIVKHSTHTSNIHMVNPAVNRQYNVSHLPKLLYSLGVIPLDGQTTGSLKDYYPVLLDGRLLGYLHDDVAQDVEQKLRVMKVKGLKKVPPVAEICLIPKSEFASQYPALCIFTTLARMVRPVHNLRLKKIEWIGTFEQVYMNICITDKEAYPGVTSHKELSEVSMLSTIACLTPFSDHNQSPRNMYQCQMGKQTMGTPLHAYGHRSDNKLYRIQTPQSPVVRPVLYDHYGIDNYPLGTNAIVAVMSYTGYDMEDAMILNKASFQRGFGHGSVYKSEFINLKEKSRERRSSASTLIFSCKPSSPHIKSGKLDMDGLPPVGTFLQAGDPYYSYVNIQTGEEKVEKYKHQEPAYVDNIKILSDDQGTGDLSKVCFVLRVQRNPIIGDKFSSRHGQKGICSMLWPVESMPYSESGMTPDIIFNPHGFPSRMTIGMMIESMAGKSAALHGLCHDATPFSFSEDQPAIDYFGQMLTKAGYNYFGTERMYSGVNGRELEADIFIGVVYYQRLRHMVSDKFQVRTTGPIDQVTHQPIKGRKRGGGIRFGEMERDGLISHGTTFLLQDRLLNCSDSSLAHVCTECGSILSPLLERPPSSVAAVSVETQRKWTCSVCNRSDTIQLIKVPYVFRYLIAELAAMSINVELNVKKV
ncbi:hypothetical protein FSP39_008990 [Pinctada imbricata]|uniref:DNA-directed RNA polymerase subunit beta n=1 Tax=Pinctada imbricata TaxID=66713 RepID=A0AA89CAQ0_PINIB|nr:hypothetical protein FSP39_008990 [Pinctada imbricata]